MAVKKTRKAAKPAKSNKNMMQPQEMDSNVTQLGRPSLKAGPYDVSNEDPGHDEGNLPSNPKLPGTEGTLEK